MSEITPQTFSPRRHALPARPQRVCDVVLDALSTLGFEHAFGIMGGALVPLYSALSAAASEWTVTHCRHESGAVFAAIEASLASDRPVLTFATTGPGLTNALTGMATARCEGARVLLVSGCTSAGQNGRFALQDSGPEALMPGLYQRSGLFDFATIVHDAAALPGILRTLAMGFARPQGFVAHLALPLHIQAAPGHAHAPSWLSRRARPEPKDCAQLVNRLRRPFAIWLGYGARHSAAQVRAFAEQTGAPVISTPRGKGIFDENHPQYLGVSGIVGADPDLAERLARTGVSQILVLGTRLSALSAAQDSDLIPPDGLIHIDLDQAVLGAAFPDLPIMAVHADIGACLEMLLDCLPAPHTRPFIDVRPRPQTVDLRSAGRVRPQRLMQAIQRQIVDESDSLVLAESGNSFAWTARHLQFQTPHRYRQSGAFCPMGHVCAGAIGAALASARRAVAVVGDGAMLMQNEINTAVAAQARVVWIVLNDARYGMVEQGLSALGQSTSQMRFPDVDFALMARALGAASICVENEGQIEAALDAALQSKGPFVVDVWIDPSEPAPFGGRVRSIDSQTQGVA